MKGRYHIEVYNSAIHYFLDIERNINVLKGNSATGKSELIRLITEYNQSGTSSGVTVLSEKKLSVLTNEEWQVRLHAMHDRIIFIDEENAFMRTKEFASMVKNSDNYFVLISRNNLYELPYSINAVYGLRESSRYMNAEKVYNEMYSIYPEYNANEISVNCVITEDSNSGYQFFNNVFENTISAGGKGNVLEKLRDASEHHQKAIAVVDGAAFGPEMEKVYEWLKWNPGNALYAPESFEYLILTSGIYDVPDDVVHKTYDYADSQKYMSWEQFYTQYLIQTTERTNHPYHKNKLDSFYLTKGNVKDILKQIPVMIKVMS